MKRRLGQIILAIAAAAAFAFALAGCGEDEGKKVYDYLVTFDYNVGNLLGEPEKDEDGNPVKDVKDQYLGVAENSLLVVYPGNSAGVKFDLSEIKGYYIEGWYLGKTDEEGVPAVGENGCVELDRKWDFSSDRVNNDLTLYAKLLPRPVLSFMVDGVAQKTFEGLPGSSFNKPSISVDIPTKEGWTLYDYYSDPECKQPMQWPFVFGTEDTPVYTKFYEGKWTFVKTANEFLSSVALRENIWLENDIDLSESKWNGNYNYSGTINGNNHSITGIRCSFAASPATGTNFALFGVLSSAAHLYDLSITGVQIDFTAMRFGDYKAALFAQEIMEGAKIENVTVSGRLTGRHGEGVEGVRMDLFPVCIEGNSDFPTCDFSGITTENLTVGN